MRAQFDIKLLTDIKEGVICDQVLNLRSNEIDDEKAILLADALKKNVHIKFVYLADNKIGDKGIIALASVSYLTKLDVSTNQFGLSGLEALANSNLQSLNISDNKIGEGIVYFADNSNLRKLDASEGEISSSNIVAFVEKLKKAKGGSNLEILCLDHNQIDDLGAKALVQIKVPALLSLTYNEITDKSIFKNYITTHLLLNHNPCNEEEDLAFLLDDNDNDNFDFETKETQFSKIESKATERVSKDEAKKVSCEEGIFKGSTPINKGSTEEDKKLTTDNKSPLSRRQ